MATESQQHRSCRPLQVVTFSIVSSVMAWCVGAILHLRSNYGDSITLVALSSLATQVVCTWFLASPVPKVWYSFCVAGWLVGYTLCPEVSGRVIDPLERLGSSSRLGFGLITFLLASSLLAQLLYAGCQLSQYRPKRSSAAEENIESTHA